MHAEVIAVIVEQPRRAGSHKNRRSGAEQGLAGAGGGGREGTGEERGAAWLQHARAFCTATPRSRARSVRKLFCTSSRHLGARHKFGILCKYMLT